LLFLCTHNAPASSALYIFLAMENRCLFINSLSLEKNIETCG
jgi:hypothetical protein